MTDRISEQVQSGCAGLMAYQARGYIKSAENAYDDDLVITEITVSYRLRGKKKTISVVGPDAHIAEDLFDPF